MTMTESVRPSATRHLDALEMQLSLHRFWDSDGGHTYARNFWAAVEGRKAESQADADWFASMQVEALKVADTFWVSEEMTEFAEHQANSPHLHPLFQEALPSNSGFILLDKSVVYSDAFGQPMSFRAFSWCQIRISKPESMKESQPGIYLALYTDLHDAALLGTDPAVRDIQEYLSNGQTRLGTRLILAHHNPWIYEREYALTEEISLHGKEIDGKTVIVSTELQVQKFLAALWAIMATPITVENRGRFFPRPLGKRAAAAFGFIPDIRVVTLRRVRHTDKPEGGSEIEHREVEWSHRWVVSGHKRWIHPKDGSASYQTWVRPYIKGPEDKPLVFKDTIYRVSR